MEDKKMLVPAQTFFENETDELKKELEVESLLVDIACTFIKYRADRNMTQKELAQKLQISQAMISKLESGEYNPTVKMLFEIAQKLNWNFRLEFNSIPEKSVYEYEYKELDQSNEYFKNMGLAS